jgi:pyruvate/2-oxoglutarate dehydrogenase complex dihydrolipoamide acyltransferase (E2) component
MEETGFDIEALIAEGDFVEATLAGKYHKFFIVPGLDPERQQFAPQCKFEIGAYAWHNIADLPAAPSEAKQVFAAQDGSSHRFWCVWPFIKPLRQWIKKRRQAQQRGGGGGGASTSAATPPPVPTGAQPPATPPPAAAQAAAAAAAQAAAHQEQLRRSHVEPQRHRPMADFAFDRAAIMAALKG